MVISMVAPMIAAYCLNGCLQTDIYNYHDFFSCFRLICIITIIYIRYTISKISISHIMYTTIILCRNYLQIVRSNYVYFGLKYEYVCLSVFFQCKEEA